jgi:Protein of unknown function (DUF3574)
VVTLILDNTLTNEMSVNEIVDAYIQQFNQESVLVAANQEVSVNFGSGDLFANSLVPDLILLDLYFGRNIAGGGQVSESQFQAFVDTVLTPRFPAGLTVFDANGQFLDSTGTLIQEPSKVVTLILDNTLTNEMSVNEIVDAYIQQFNQESVLIVADNTVRVGFQESAVVPEPSSAMLFLVSSVMIAAWRWKKGTKRLAFLSPGVE